MIGLERDGALDHPSPAAVAGTKKDSQLPETKRGGEGAWREREGGKKHAHDGEGQQKATGRGAQTKIVTSASVKTPPVGKHASTRVQESSPVRGAATRQTANGRPGVGGSSSHLNHLATPAPALLPLATPGPAPLPLATPAPPLLPLVTPTPYDPCPCPPTPGDPCPPIPWRPLPLPPTPGDPCP